MGEMNSKEMQTNSKYKSRLTALSLPVETIATYVFFKFKHTLSVKVTLPNWLDCRPFVVRGGNGQIGGPGIGIGHKHSSGYATEPLSIVSLGLAGISGDILLCEWAGLDGSVITKGNLIFWKP